MMSEGGGVLEELLRGSLDHCVKCTICETACPFSNVTPLFPGPKYVGPQAERFRTDEPVPDASGARVVENVLVAGATLAGARPWKEKSGDGVSLASGHRAAELIMEES